MWDAVRKAKAVRRQFPPGSDNRRQPKTGVVAAPAVVRCSSRAEEHKLDCEPGKLWLKCGLAPARVQGIADGLSRRAPFPASLAPIASLRGCSQLRLRFGHKEVPELLALVQTMTLLKALGT